ncbi:MAG: hypothetical protein ACK56I_29955, partial [bacterium]
IEQASGPLFRAARSRIPALQRSRLRQQPRLIGGRLQLADGLQQLLGPRRTHISLQIGQALPRIRGAAEGV